MIKQRNDNLTKEEELQLGEKIQAMKKIKARIKAGYDKVSQEEQRIINEGDEALEILIGNYYNLARDIAHKHHKRTGTNYDIEDLLQDAISALVEAAYDYDPAKNCKLSTYAFYGITKKVSSIINFQRLVRMPENKMGEYVKISKAQQIYSELSQDEKEKYSNELDFVYQNVDLAKEEIDLILSNMQPTVSLNAEIGEGETEMMNLIKDEKAHLEVVRIEALGEEVINVLKSLNQYELDLIAYEFGVFEASMAYQDFLETYELNDKKVKFETNKVIRKMQKLAAI